MKYSQLHRDLRDAIVSLPSAFRQTNRVQDAEQTLVYADTIYNLWLTNGWKFVSYNVNMHSAPWEASPYEAEFDWIRSHTTMIDMYAAQGTQPTVGVFIHFTRVHEHASGLVDTCWSPSQPSDIKVLRNLHRFMDAVSLYAYWTVIQAYQIWGERLVIQRLQIALHDDRYIEYVGTLSSLPKICLENICEQFETALG